MLCWPISVCLYHSTGMDKYYLLDSIYWLSVVCGFVSFKVEAGDNLYVVEA